jgi:hypothetical protein
LLRYRLSQKPAVIGEKNAAGPEDDPKPAQPPQKGTVLLPGEDAAEKAHAERRREAARAGGVELGTAESSRNRKSSAPQGSFSPQEQAIADYLEGLGRTLEKNRREGVEGAGRQADALVDGRLHEFKTLDPGATSATVRNVVNDSLRRGGQARDIVIDARGSDLDRQMAEKGVARAFGIAGDKVDNIAIIGEDYFFNRQAPKRTPQR